MLGSGPMLSSLYITHAIEYHICPACIAVWLLTYVQNVDVDMRSFVTVVCYTYCKCNVVSSSAMPGKCSCH